MVMGNRCQLANQQVPDLFQQESFFVGNPKAILVLFPFQGNLDLVAVDGLLPEPDGTAKLDIPSVFPMPQRSEIAAKHRPLLTLFKNERNVCKAAMYRLNHSPIRCKPCCSIFIWLPFMNKMPGTALDGVAVGDPGKKFQKFNNGGIDLSGCSQASECFESN